MPPETDLPAGEHDDADGELSLRMAERLLDDQSARFQGLLARLPVTATLISVIVGFSAVAFALLAPEPSLHQLSLGVVTLIIFLISVGCTSVALQKNLRHRGPSPRRVLSLERSAGPVVARAWAVEQMAIAYAVNEPAVESTRRWARAAQIGAFVDALFAVATLISVLFT